MSSRLIAFIRKKNHTYELAGILFALLLWEGASWVFSPLAIPGPIESLKALILNNCFAADLAMSLLRSWVASVLVVVLGLLSMRAFFFFPSVGTGSEWALSFWRSIPPIVVIPPVFLMISDREFSSRVVLALIGAYPVFMANVSAGLRAMPPSRLETVRLLSRDNKAEIYRHVVSKELRPHLIVGYRISFAFCVIIVVVSEMVWGTTTPGIGTRVRDALSNSDAPQAWAMILSLSGITGVFINRGPGST